MPKAPFVLTLFVLLMTTPASGADIDADAALAAIAKAWPAPGTAPEQPRWQAWAKAEQALWATPFHTEAVPLPAARKGSDGTWTADVSSTDPKVPFTGSLALGTKAPPANARLRFVYQVWGVSAQVGRTVVTAAEVGTLDAKGAFTVALKVPVRRIWDFDLGARGQPRLPKLFDDVVVEGGAPGFGYSFRFGSTPITQIVYEQVTGQKPSQFQKGLEAPWRPVEQVNWFEAARFCNLVSEFEGLTPVYTFHGDPEKSLTGPWDNLVVANWLANGWRIPFNAEFDYASRGGVKSSVPPPDLDATSWNATNSGGTTHPVGTKAPNQIGLYDMLGNVNQWTFFKWTQFSESTVGGAAWDDRSLELLVPGGHGYWGGSLYRNHLPQIGVRLVRRDFSLPPPPQPAPPALTDTPPGALTPHGLWELDPREYTVQLPPPNDREEFTPTIKVVFRASGRVQPEAVDLNEMNFQELREAQTRGDLISHVYYRVVPRDGTFGLAIQSLDLAIRTAAGPVSVRVTGIAGEQPIGGAIPQAPGSSWIAAAGLSTPSGAVLGASQPLSRAVATELEADLRGSALEKPTDPADTLSWYDAVTLSNAISTADGLTPVYDAVDVPGTLRGPTLKADFARSGWRLPTVDEAKVLAARGAARGLDQVWCWDAASGPVPGARVALDVTGGTLVARDPERGAEQGLGILLVRRDPKATGGTWFAGSVPPLPAAPLPASLNRFALVCKAFPDQRLALDPSEGTAGFVDAKTAADTAVWSSQAVEKSGGGYRLFVAARGGRPSLEPKRQLTYTSADVVQVKGFGPSNAPAEAWKLVDQGGGWYVLSHSETGTQRVLTADPSSVWPVQLTAPGLADNQLWRLVPVQ